MTQSQQEVRASSRPEERKAIEAEYKVKRPYKKIAFIVLGICSFVLLVIFGLRWWAYASTHEETDDAYVQGHVHNVSPRIAGTISRVLVDDNQYVKTGQLLAQIDPRDYVTKVQQAAAAVALAQQQAAGNQVGVPQAAANYQAKEAEAVGNVSGAQANISAAEANVSQAKAGVAAAQAQLAQANAGLIKASSDYQRYRVLAQEGAVPAQQLDQAVEAWRSARAERDAAQENIRAAQSKVAASQQAVLQARANLVATKGQVAAARASKIQITAAQQQYKTSEANVAQAKAVLKDAQLQLSYTNIVAPSSGKIGRRSVEVGQRVQPGQALMAVVERKPWIAANFKETQLERIRPGQVVEIKLDAFPHHTFLGHVTGISPASGAEFALLPPENATGNFTKVVQRVPVKIEFDPQSIRGFENRIAPGMSSVVDVRVK